MPKDIFSTRLKDISEELDRLHVKKSELALELKDDNSQTVSVVRSLLGKFDKLLESSSFDQRKTLMHLVANPSDFRNI